MWAVAMAQGSDPLICLRFRRLQAAYCQYQAVWQYTTLRTAANEIKVVPQCDNLIVPRIAGY